MTNSRWVPCLAQKEKGSEGYSKTVHPEKAFATKPDDLSLTAEIHMAAGELCQLPSDLVDLCMGCVCPHTHTQAKYLKVAEQRSLIPISVLPRPKNRTPKGPHSGTKTLEPSPPCGEPPSSKQGWSKFSITRMTANTGREVSVPSPFLRTLQQVMG